ncbi:MAG: hypothetical protein KGI89_03055 [Euryarchaeota archaeon]|nr:hypothetical protein [Euryarchaeota archaeon]
MPVYDRATEKQVREHIFRAMQEIERARLAFHPKGGDPLRATGARDTAEMEEHNETAREIREHLMESQNWLASTEYRWHTPLHPPGRSG